MSGKQRLSERVRSYLLGTLADETAAAVEERYFTDRSFFEFVQSEENELIRDYLGDRLSLSFRRKFEEHYLSVPELRLRVEEVRAEQTLAPRPFMNPHRARLAVVMAAVLVCAGASALFFYRNRTPNVPQSIVTPRPVIATLSLSPGLLKGEGPGSGRLRLPSTAGEVRLLLELPGQTRPIACFVKLEVASPEGVWKEIWSAKQPVLSLPFERGQQVQLVLDAALLQRGDYRIALAGADGPARETYHFDVSSPDA